MINSRLNDPAPMVKSRLKELERLVQEQCGVPVWLHGCISEWPNCFDCIDAQAVVCLSVATILTFTDTQLSALYMTFGSQGWIVLFDLVYTVGPKAYYQGQY